MASLGGPNIVTSGLVLSLDAANVKSYPGSGTTWRDLSGNSNNGTLTNGPTFSSANGGSIVFDGINDYVECGTTLGPLNSWTANAWVINRKTTGAAIFVARSGGSPLYDQNIILGWGSTVNNRFYVSGKTTTGVYFSSCTSSFSPNTSSIYNVVGCFDAPSTTLSLYINGVLDNSKVVGTLFTTGSNLFTQIGCSDGLTLGNFASGNIYNASIYNRALTASEVLQNYNSIKSRFNL